MSFKYFFALALMCESGLRDVIYCILCTAQVGYCISFYFLGLL